jgi:hypothetical protein
MTILKSKDFIPGGLYIVGKYFSALLYKDYDNWLSRAENGIIIYNESGYIVFLEKEAKGLDTTYWFLYDNQKLTVHPSYIRYLEKVKYKK